MQNYSVLFLHLDSRRRRCRLFTLYTPGGLTGSQTLTGALGSRSSHDIMGRGSVVLKYKKIAETAIYQRVIL
jgi:hypothetical protein